MIVPLSSLADNDDWLDNAREDWAAMNLTPLSQDVSQCIMSKYVHFQLSPVPSFSKLFLIFYSILCSFYDVHSCFVIAVNVLYLCVFVQHVRCHSEALCCLFQ